MITTYGFMIDSIFSIKNKHSRTDGKCSLSYDDSFSRQMINLFLTKASPVSAKIDG